MKRLFCLVALLAILVPALGAEPTQRGLVHGFLVKDGSPAGTALRHRERHHPRRRIYYAFDAS